MTQVIELCILSTIRPSSHPMHSIDWEQIHVQWAEVGALLQHKWHCVTSEQKEKMAISCRTLAFVNLLKDNSLQFTCMLIVKDFYSCGFVHLLIRSDKEGAFFLLAIHLNGENPEKNKCPRSQDSRRVLFFGHLHRWGLFFLVLFLGKVTKLAWDIVTLTGPTEQMLCQCGQHHWAQFKLKIQVTIVTYN